jgi:cell division protein DivIC
MKERLFRNRYVILLTLYALWMLVFDGNNLVYRYQVSQEIQDLEEQQAYYQKAIEKARRERQDLFGNLRNLERFGREKYLMKKHEEDLYIIVNPEQEQP